MASHFAADGRALLARFDAFFHAADLAAGLGTGFANLRAGSAGFTMKGRVEQHYVRCRAAAFHAGQHDAVMFRLDMRPAFFKAVAGGRVEANAIAIKAGIDTSGHFGARHFQILFPSTRSPTGQGWICSMGAIGRFSFPADIPGANCMTLCRTIIAKRQIGGTPFIGFHV
ncbi:hypothetical protein ACI50E_17230 [Brucella sp. ZJ1_1]|uniref:hypothetical protein n=1 Tax=Brucella TaxID=234 RepID=UPI00055A3549|nr:hypothetical protein [Brucella intermedia]OOC60018.1 hypothetical protein AS855_05220 [Brucella intermedia M86]